MSLLCNIQGSLPSAYTGARFKELVYLMNVDKVVQSLTVEALKGRALVLHPVHTAATAADQRAASATFTAASGVFQIPARTAVVFVVN